MQMLGWLGGRGRGEGVGIGVELASAGLGEGEEGRGREREVLKSRSASRVDGLHAVEIVGVARDVVDVARVP